MTQRVVVFDAYPFDVGGAHRLISRLADALPAKRWTLRAVLPAEGPAADYLRHGGVDVDILAAPASLLHYGGSTKGARALNATTALPRYWSHWQRHLRANADVVAINDIRGMLLAGPAARRAGVPVLWWVHAWPTSLRPLLRPLSRLADEVIASSAPLLAAVSSTGEVVTPPVDLPDPRTPRRGRPVIVSIARIHPQKGIDVLVEASGRLRERGLEHTVVVAGSGRGDQTEHDLRALITRRGLDGTFTLAGDVADVSDVLARGTVYVQSSRTAEGFGMAALEAMACGLPVVVSDVGGLRELVGDAGVRVPPDDPGALANAIETLVRKAPLRTELGQAARGRAAEFGPKEWAAKMLGAIERTAAARS